MAAQDVRHVGAFPGSRTADHHPDVFQEHGHELFHGERAMAIEGIRAGVGIELPDQFRQILGGLVVDFDLDAFHGLLPIRAVRARWLLMGLDYPWVNIASIPLGKLFGAQT